MAHASRPAYRFSDMLALARQSWLAQTAEALCAMGYPDYRRSDAPALRLLQRGPVSISRLGDALGVTRQAARKAAAGLERRGYAVTTRDARDARQINLSLTRDGEAYAQAIVAVIERMNQDLSKRVRPADLVAADTVLRAVLMDDHARSLADHLPRPDDKGSDALP